MSSPEIPRELPTHLQEMTAACETGELQKLQQLFASNSADARDPAILPGQTAAHPRTSPLATWDLLRTAIKHKNASIVEFILQSYPSTTILWDDILATAVENPDLDTFKVLHKYDPEIINFDFHHVETTFLKACRSSDPVLPDYMLDHGVDWHATHFVACSAILWTIQWRSQPDWIIKKMIDKGARCDISAFEEAIKQERLYLIRLLASKVRRVDPGDSIETPLELARETKDDEIIVLVERWVKQRHEEIRRRTRGEGKRWWQIWM